MVWLFVMVTRAGQAAALLTLAEDATHLAVFVQGGCLLAIFYYSWWYNLLAVSICIMADCQVAKYVQRNRGAGCFGWDVGYFLLYYCRR